LIEVNEFWIISSTDVRDQTGTTNLCTEKIRRYLYMSHLVYYEVKKEHIVIIRIRNVRQKP